MDSGGISIAGLPHRLKGFPDIPGHQADVAEADLIRPGGWIPASACKQLQVLTGRQDQINRRQGTVLPVHAEGFLQAEDIGIIPDAVQDAARADCHVAQP